MNESPQDTPRSSEKTESEKLLRTIDNYVWKATGVREALLARPLMRPLFQAKVADVEGMWSLALDKQETVRIMMNDISYGLSKGPDGTYVVTIKKGKNEKAYDARSPQASEFLKTLEGMLDAYARQIEQGMKADRARQQLKDTILKRRSPKQ